MRKLLLLHGALGSRKQFETIIPLLQNDFEILTLDFDGHGRSHSPHEFSIDLFTTNVLDYLRQNQIQSIDIFGYSMGGYVALNAALRLPSAVDKIVTLGTKIDWNLETASKEVKMLDPEKIAEKVPDYAKKLKDEHSQDWKEVLRKTGRMMLGLAETNKLIDDDFLKIQNQVTIGIGSLDHMVTLEESEKVSKILLNASLHILEGAKHPIEKVDNVQLASYIKEHLGDNH